jgi:EAL domain-containing protein (putative c-di-GMP-specific phosphodiesterase class I)
LPVSVNLSPRQFREKDLVASLRRILNDTGSRRGCWNWRSPRAR